MSSTPFGLTAPQVGAVLTAATRAPSLHNSQPWAFVLGDDRIEVHVDARRVLPVTDPDGRETRLACGAALFNLRLALARQGVLAKVSLPSTAGSSLVAVVESGGHTALSPERAELERAIPHRRTNRRPFFDAEVDVGYHHTLAHAAEAERGALQVVTEPARLAELRAWAAEAHRHQQADPAWMAEWRRWTGRSGTADGVPITAAGPSPAPQDQWTLRDFGSPDRPDRIAGKDFEERPLLVVLASFTDAPTAQVQAGQALQRVLLAATNLGLAASFLSQLIEVAPVRLRLRAALGGRSYPQAVLRVGFGGPVPATARRPWQDCMAEAVNPAVPF